MRGGYNAEEINKNIGAVAAWAKNNNVLVMANEFGVIKYAPGNSQYLWTRDVRVAMFKNKISWTIYNDNLFNPSILPGNKVDRNLIIALQQ
jgi:hypothetical protein